MSNEEKKMVRMSFTVPPEVRDDLAYLSGRLGVSKSAFVSELLGESLHDLRGLVEQVPDRPDEGHMLRFRGASEDLIEQRVNSIRKLGNDLFAE